MDHQPRQPLQELVVSNMWGLAALVEVLERKGILSQREIVDAIEALRTRDGEPHEKGGSQEHGFANPEGKGGAPRRSRVPGLRSV